MAPEDVGFILVGTKEKARQVMRARRVRKAKEEREVRVQGKLETTVAI